MHESADPSRHEISAPAAALTAPRPRSERRLHGLAAGFFGLVALTCALIVVGALVRAHEAGLACPDWPLCFGDLIPRMNLKVAFEWGHRAFAGGISVAFAVLAVRALRRPGAPDAVRVLIATAAGLLAAQVVLGALTVWLQLAPWTVTAHLIIGNGFSLTLLLIACSLRDAGKERPARAAAPPAARALVIASAAVLLLQMVLGGLVSSRYAGLACPEWPACNGGVWIPTWDGRVGLHLLHRFNAYALLAVLAVSAAVGRRDAGLRRLTGLALTFGLGEAAVGVVNVRLGLPAEITGLHTGLAAALVLTLTLALRDIFTRTAPRP
jgi:cytochrome c oxidase assembly protein subunit 15